MCRRCWDEAGQPSINTSGVQRAARRIREVYEEDALGGNMHVVIEDWNVRQSDLDWCAPMVTTVAERRCHEALNDLTEDERTSALALYDGFR